MAWQIEGTYFETCSCEVVCPCTASLALGADYDRCRVTLVFHVADGDVDGTDVERADGRRRRRHAEGHDRRQLAPGRLHRRQPPPTSRPRSSAACSAGSSAARWPALGAAHRREPRRRAGADRGPRGRACATASGSATRSTSRSRTSSRSAWSRASRRGSSGIFHPAGSELTIARATRSNIDAFGVAYEGKSGFSSSRSPGRPEREHAPADARRRRSPRPAPAWALDRAAVRARGRRVVVDGRPDGAGWTPDRAPRSGASAGSSASGS